MLCKFKLEFARVLGFGSARGMLNSHHNYWDNMLDKWRVKFYIIKCDAPFINSLSFITRFVVLKYSKVAVYICLLFSYQFVSVILSYMTRIIMGFFCLWFMVEYPKLRCWFHICVINWRNHKLLPSHWFTNLNHIDVADDCNTYNYKFAVNYFPEK